jgi:hypothetical protein
MEEIMIKLNEFSHNHHPSRVKILAKYIRRGISVIIANGVCYDSRYKTHIIYL